MIGIERRFSDDTRLIDLTVGDLKELITSLISKIKQIEEKRYVYGLQGLADLWVSPKTLWICYVNTRK